jgi:hypothetical protein
MILQTVPHAGLLPHDTPGTFAALMDVYERNYINLRRLIPTLPPVSATRISRIAGGLDLHLQIIERSRYTSELSLTYQFAQESGAIFAEPNLRIRIYHDAQLAEVMAAQPRHYAAFTADLLLAARPDSSQLRRRWQINRFLFKWLTYCLRQGHRFGEAPHRLD